MVGQLFTLLAVMLGAAMSYAASTLTDRAKYRRDQGERRSERRLDAYVAYLDDVKQMRLIARRMLGGSSLDPNLPIALPQDEGLPMLADAEARRSISAERVLLLAPTNVVDSLRLVNQAVWRIEWFARGLITDPTPDAWSDAERQYRAAITSFHRSARRDLQIPGDGLPPGADDA